MLTHLQEGDGATLSCSSAELQLGTILEESTSRITTLLWVLIIDNSKLDKFSVGAEECRGTGAVVSSTNI